MGKTLYPASRAPMCQIPAIAKSRRTTTSAHWSGVRSGMAIAIGLELEPLLVLVLLALDPIYILRRLALFRAPRVPVTKVLAVVGADAADRRAACYFRPRTPPLRNCLIMRV